VDAGRWRVVDSGALIAARLAERLEEIEGVQAVVLGGSRARRVAWPNSDVDIGIYYLPENPPSVDALRRLARELDDRHLPNLLTDLGGWGPWINGGGWLRVEGRPVDWLYRDLTLVTRTVEECRAGRPTSHYQPGHPHGFHSHIYAGEVYYCDVLRDPSNYLSGLKSLTADYPPLLKRALVRRFGWEAGFALDTSRKSAERGETFYVTGCLFRCVACLIQVLFAINERYFVNEKGSVRTVESFSYRPDGFGETVNSVLSRPGDGPDRLTESIERLAELVRDVGTLSSRHLNEDG
jgi:predicted nucleotidyltransferase